MTAPREVVSVLAVSALEDEILFLEHIFSHSNWSLQHVRSCGEAHLRLAASDVPVVLCSCTLPDGTWKDVLASRTGDERPHVIVIAPVADDQLWSEVLDLGGYDVVCKPLEPKEVVRVISLAWRQWQDQRARAERGRKAPGG